MSKTKIVLLPGLDGTGKLFSPLLTYLQAYDCIVIPLPAEGEQSYTAITEKIKTKLPEEDFILIAESFSGPIGAALAQENIKQMKGIIFVATFLSTPSPFILRLCKQLPLKAAIKLPFSHYLIRKWLFNAEANENIIQLFLSTVQSLPSSLIKKRLKTIQSLLYTPKTSQLPAVYIQAISDKLVPSKKVLEFKDSFTQMNIIKIEGPHFILQTQAAACALIIKEQFINLCNQ